MTRWDVFDVAFMGTSLTWPPSSDGWLFACEATLQGLVSMPVSFYQMGVGGAVAAGGYAARGTATSIRPKVAVLEYAMNDASTANGISVASFKATMENFVDAIRVGSPDTVVALMTMNPVIGSGAVSNPNLPLYYEALRDIAAAKEALLIDNTPLWETPTALQIPDGIHPTGSALRQVTVPNVANCLAALAS